MRRAVVQVMEDGDQTCARGPEPPHVDVTAGKTGCLLFALAP